jgi:DNA-binding transcriptional MocR family regulator
VFAGENSVPSAGCFQAKYLVLFTIKIEHLPIISRKEATPFFFIHHSEPRESEEIPFMSVSQLARSIAESPTLKLTEEARLLREKGEAVIHLGAGEPKNKAPMNAILSSAAKLITGDVKYTPTDGTPSLKRAVIRYTEENYDRLVAPENIIVSAGAKQSVFNVLYSILNPQEEVIILAPYWVSYP